MIEANENIDLVTMRRQQELGRAQESYQRAVSEGRLVVRPHQGAPTDGSAALVATGQGGAGGQVTTSAPLPEVAASTAQPEVAPSAALPADSDAAWRHTRLAITAGLVVLLLVIWIWQKRAGR